MTHAWVANISHLRRVHVLFVNFPSSLASLRGKVKMKEMNSLLFRWLFTMHLFSFYDIAYMKSIIVYRRYFLKILMRAVVFPHWFFLCSEQGFGMLEVATKIKSQLSVSRIAGKNKTIKIRAEKMTNWFGLTKVRLWIHDYIPELAFSLSHPDIQASQIALIFLYRKYSLSLSWQRCVRTTISNKFS